MPTIDKLDGDHGGEQDRPATRSSERKYGMASRQMTASVETRPVTG